MTRPKAVPVIPGWVTQRQDPTDEHPRGLLKATRIEELSEYQVEYGCRREIFAPTSAELEVLAVAEVVHAAMVAKAADHAEAVRRMEEMAVEAAALAEETRKLMAADDKA